MNSIAVLVLAAGTSSRMKDIKQLLKINNKTLLENALETAKNLESATVFCVVGAHAEKIKQETKTANINFILNKNFEKGLSSSIVSGVKYIKNLDANFSAILMLLADQPEVNSSYLKKLIKASKKYSNKIIASSYKNIPGVPTIFPKIYFNALVQLKGDKGAKDLLLQNSLEIIKIKSNKIIIDIDSKEDYESYLKSI